ncbi:3'(2'),5'-bisphosphate nucleotidase CysQ [Roseicyclus persicicus]|uniref:3'(2'),5'-bisphosphate nucleotidase CysQ n=1 Tax=Roseicyclus persicicus TaxID=2650661 RepID=A0A7X6H077_9RHOB|nr:3'(2'),5'-bisphosphate nucleotidase CysQ [Roseibacterium persicicum]NKX45624.1 3'(2'),5'-bisphosphate nucleotidase CysQ [Roseibacterium persicicum]
MPAPDPREDLGLLIDAARGAGRIAARYFRDEPEVWDKPGGAGPVTEADLAVNDMLRDRLTDARPGYGWLSEETPDDTARLGKARVFVIDPIDGTQAFIEGSSSFAHSLAVVEEGEVIAAVVYLPIRGKLYAAARGHGATLNDTAIRASATRHLYQAEVLATKHTLSPAHWPQGVPQVTRAYRPSLAYRMALVGEGRFDAMVTFRQTWEWDIAAGALIIAEAGGRATDATGAPLSFNRATPQVPGVLAAAADLHGAILKARG